MSFVCIVCRELLSNHPHNNVDNPAGAAGGVVFGNVDLVSTKCGHLYHLICLNDWFNKQRNPKQECPHCRSAVGTGDFQRIFPTGDEETDDIEARIKKAKEMKLEQEVLKNEIQQYAGILEETGTELDGKTLALDILQFEYNEKLAEFQALQDENKDLKEMLLTTEKLSESLNESVQKQNAAWEKKLEEANKKLAVSKSEIESLKAQKVEDVSFNSTSNSQDLVLNEIKALQRQMTNSFSAPSSRKNSMACQTDFPSLPLVDEMLLSLPRSEMIDILMKFLEKEKITQKDLQQTQQLRSISQDFTTFAPQVPPRQGAPPGKPNSSAFPPSIIAEQLLFPRAIQIQNANLLAAQQQEVLTRPTPAKRVNQPQRPVPFSNGHETMYQNLEHPTTAHRNNPQHLHLNEYNGNNNNTQNN